MAFYGASDLSLLNSGGLAGIMNYPAKTVASNSGGFQRSREPITTATSVLGVKFKEGVILAADMLGSYGSLARFRDCPRVFKVNENIIVGAGGDYADFQYLRDVIEQKVIDDECIDDGFKMKPKALYHWLTRVLYNRRSQMDPLWNNYVIAGLQDGEPFLGTVDKLGTAFLDDHIATGFGAYLAMPIMRDAVEQARPNGGLERQDALNLINKCIEILYYRDARSWPKFQIGTITPTEVKIEGPFTVKGNWDVAAMIYGYE